MTQIELRGIEKHFGAVQVIKDLNLTIADNEFIVLLGQSGCGKTTTLRAIAGLETIDEGDILIDSQPVQHIKAAHRDIAFVFQSFSLYPHMTVFENIAFPLRATRGNRADIEREVQAVAKTLQITHLLVKKPSALSGGDMQRVAIGRALVRRPKAMLMDEPIGALDAKLREEMRAEIKRLHIKQGSTTIYVTHDQVEAMSLADRIVVMHEGVLQQVGSPHEVYARPANMFVAQFVGSPVMNMSDVTVSEDAGHARVVVRGAPTSFDFPSNLTAQLAVAGAQNGNLTLGVRPEGVLVSREAREGFVPVEAHIIEPLGSHDIIDLKVGDQMLRARTKSGFVRRPGEAVWARIDPAQAHFFDSSTGTSFGIRL
ncbi:ABC transporter ATP-binding protein [Sinorhizobium meliloti]|uniref:ATP-binding cassette domain-containing protein n=3 Tax=Rhizobium meliloti TaxID=382 RepID=A0AAW9TJ23_RHIML|nr:ABC transporter ATP-binding protein [Sinorhizobium meliloti]AEG57440.1 Glycerol-3-phosphate-transporting ATPase [Sinorhizobium meliloti AK83]AEH81995.1 ABC transporter, ATP-binding protein [Sinorhizobium meliloti SM11]ARS66628.1 ABC transporter ATP-binding protein [Sinorhizobium meliloti RU11/001]ASP54859.1 ABC transporter ATP-binding protein [Sinorhizobium meliloti]ASP67080.1 ABC transporter ATP-binding protein [Sinorhizobium meliloti]